MGLRSSVCAAFVAFVALALLPFAHIVAPENLSVWIALYYDAISSSPISVDSASLLGLSPSAGHFAEMLTASSPPPRFFEGWYYKLLQPEGGLSVAAVPGVFFDGDSRGYAFIMIAEARPGQKATTTFHNFDLSEVKIAAEPDDGYRFQIGANVFTHDGLSLAIPGRAEGDLRLVKSKRYLGSGLHPTPMGSLAFAPFSPQCMHGVVAVDAALDGSLRLDGSADALDFSGGNAYVEKDWGESFPRRYVWMQVLTQPWPIMRPTRIG